MLHHHCLNHALIVHSNLLRKLPNHVYDALFDAPVGPNLLGRVLMEVCHAELEELAQVLRLDLENGTHEVNHAGLCVQVTIVGSAQKLDRLITELRDVLISHYDDWDRCLEENVVDVRLDEAEKLRDANRALNESDRQIEDGSRDELSLALEQETHVRLKQLRHHGAHENRSEGLLAVFRLVLDGECQHSVVHHQSVREFTGDSFDLPVQ